MNLSLQTLDVDKGVEASIASLNDGFDDSDRSPLHDLEEIGGVSIESLSASKNCCPCECLMRLVLVVHSIPSYIEEAIEAAEDLVCLIQIEGDHVSHVPQLLVVFILIFVLHVVVDVAKHSLDSLFLLLHSESCSYIEPMNGALNLQSVGLSYLCDVIQDLALCIPQLSDDLLKVRSLLRFSIQTHFLLILPGQSSQNLNDEFDVAQFLLSHKLLYYLQIQFFGLSLKLKFLTEGISLVP